MANTEHENPLGFVDDRRTQNQTDMPGNIDTDGRYLSTASLRAALSARQPATFTSAYMNTLTKNDLVYALRTFDDAGGIN